MNALRGLTCTLVLASSGLVQAADWKLMHSEEKIAIYVDSSRIKKAGAKVKVWELWDVGLRGKSMLMWKQYDCTNETMLTTFAELNDEPMGKGPVTRLDVSQEKLSPVPPGTPVEKVMKFVCR